VRQASRTFIGFAEGQNLQDFEATAVEAERVLRAIKTQLCRLDQQRDQGLRAASLAGSGVEISSVRFTLADLSGADVEVKWGAQDGGELVDPELLWTLRMQRTGVAWNVASSRRTAK
jgi:hypothetical protein